MTRFSLLLLLLCSGVLSMYAQNATLSGRVVDVEGNEALAKATVGGDRGDWDRETFGRGRGPGFGGGGRGGGRGGFGGGGGWGGGRP